MHRPGAYCRFCSTPFAQHECVTMAPRHCNDAIDPSMHAEVYACVHAPNTSWLRKLSNDYFDYYHYHDYDCYACVQG